MKMVRNMPFTWIIALCGLLCMQSFLGMLPEDPREKMEIQEYAKSLNLQQFSSVETGIQELHKGNFWQAIALINPVFELTTNQKLKILAAKLLGNAYNKVHEPHIAYYYFNFASNQNESPEIKQCAQEQLENLQSFATIPEVAVKTQHQEEQPPIDEADLIAQPPSKRGKMLHECALQ